uniref:Uncharacterized protein n=1 Tax=Erwinia piriflorinigrans CFBP 5888 TaxID=1161919 RepID=V5Z307_9GAMM|nr:hypothetical protein EPIR_pEPIR37042 [Erwinia piriflorinigrans CFBP 5888]
MWLMQKQDASIFDLYLPAPSEKVNRFGDDRRA